MYKKCFRASTINSFAPNRSQVSFNLVIRDHDQSAFGNGMNSTLDPRYFQIAYLWNLGNKVGEQKIFGHLETGGQEPGKTAMSGRNPGELYAKLHEVAPDTWLRSLSRGAYGNSVFPLHTNDLTKWYNFVNRSGQNKVIYKVFDYNTNIKEMETALQIISKMGAPIEIAVPQSPDQQYFEYFGRKFEEAAKKAKEYGATLSIKRMVAGLTEEEAKRVADLSIPIAMKYGINDVTLHAHGDVSAAIAAFIHSGVQYGLKNVRGDIVHKGSGGGKTNSPPTFPNFYETAERLAQLGVKINVSQEQLEILKKIDEIQHIRDSKFSAIRTSGAFSVADKVAMGMPDGGEFYTVESIIKAKLPEKLEISLEKAKELFQEYYKEFRQRFGMMVSVTPGHKRIEEGAVTSMLNTLEVIKGLAKELGVNVSDLKATELRKKLDSLPYEQLYGNLNPKTIDAIRNNHLPVKLATETFEFICRTHMRNVLKQAAFKDLDQKVIASLIENAPFVEKVSEIANTLVKESKLPKQVIQPKNEAFHPLSLIQASGVREYTENAGSLETGSQLRETIERHHRQGSPVESLYGSIEDAECIGILTGNTSYVTTSCLRGPLPTPEGLSKKQYDRELAIYYKYVNSPPGTLIQERTELLSAADGLNWLYSNLEESEQEDIDIQSIKEEAEKKLSLETRLAKEVIAHDRQISFNKSLASEKEDLPSN